MAKDKDYIRMIHTTRWLHLRKEVLTKHPLCQRCEAEGIVTPATEVHHIRPVEEAISKYSKEKLMFDPGNLIALCHDCHVKTHTEMGRSGKQANINRNMVKVKEIIKKFFSE